MTKLFKKLALVLLVAGLATPALAWDDDGGWGDESASGGFGDEGGNSPASDGAPAPRYMTSPMNRNQIVQGVVDNRNAPDRWLNSPKSVFWEDYRGNSVRIELLRTNSDMKEMRLKFVETAGMYSNPDGSIAEMLSRVAARTMKRVCGQRAVSATVLYERPGTEYMRATTGDPFMPAPGGTMIEYGFRCVY